MLQNLEVQILKLYSEVDWAVAAYQQSSVLSCPGGCGNCCISEKVESTVLEMIPAAFHLLRTNQAVVLLKRIEKQDESHQCILFRPDLSKPDSGCCSLYLDRPLVCRLFGFAGNRDRKGKAQLARCRYMPPSIEATGSDSGCETMAGENLPIFQAYGIAVTSIHPDLGTRRMPINEALYQALDKVGLVLHLEMTMENEISLVPIIKTLLLKREI